MNTTVFIKERQISTCLGMITVYINYVPNSNIPLIFLHGLYFDHHLWDEQVENFIHQTTISIDMPLHGKSKENILPHWTLDDCAKMLIEILEVLEIKKVIAIGHSWGSMTILRAASIAPERFYSIGLCNMPFRKVSKKRVFLFAFQHTMLTFRYFYTKQASKALFSKISLKNSPTLFNQFKRSMDLLTLKEIIKVDDIVIINAKDATSLIVNIKVKAIALRGEDDYVSNPPIIETIIVKGGHVSPLESPKDVIQMINRLYQ